MSDVPGILCIILAVAAYVACVRALGRELRELIERSRRKGQTRERPESHDAELIVREVDLRTTLSHMEGVGGTDLGGIDGS